MSECTLGIVVVNFGSHSLLETHLATVDVFEASTLIVVVDNFTTTAEQQLVNELCARHGWISVSSARNIGFGAGMNLGAERALELGCDTLLLLNPDARIDVGSCLRLAGMSRRQPRSLISPVINRPDGSVWFSGSRVWLSSGRVGRMDPFVSAAGSWLTGACLMVHSQMWRELGGFADGYFLYWEDVDLSWRCVALGGQLIMATDVVAEHDAGGTQSIRAAAGPAKSGTYYHYNCRNRLLFASRNLATGQLWGWLWRTPAQSVAILSRGGRRQFLTSPGLLVSGLTGTAAGIGLVLRELARRALRRAGPGNDSAGRPAAAPAGMDAA